jgi:isoleucyl-tRNA synthetase
MIPVADDEQRKNIEAVKALILSEVNVKELEFVDSANGMLVKRVKPDFKKLGPKYGKIMKPLAASIQGMSQEEINELEKRGRFAFRIEDQEAVIELADVEIISEDIPGWLVANEGRLTVALDITITDELRQEGIARELINRIQNIRKDSDFDVTDKVEITLEHHAEIDAAVENFKEYIAGQTLANSITLVNEVVNGVELDLDNDVVVKIAVKKATV